MTGSPKIWDFKCCVPRASWSSCSGPPEALGMRMEGAKPFKMLKTTGFYIQFCALQAANVNLLIKSNVTIFTFIVY